MQNTQPIDLQTLKETISLTNSDLHQLAHNHQKFVGTIRQYNNQAKAKISSDRPKQALIYLTQAEKILEYAASCGKNIDRNIIVCVLHNQACCYQRLWELQKCSNYLQALIFNISSHLKTSTPSPRQVEDYIKTSGSLSSHLRDSLYGKPINQRIQLSKYHLQFCAINSQLRNHKGALVSGRRAIAIIKDIFQELQTLSIQKSTIQNSYNPATMCPEQIQEDYQTKLHMIAGIAMINDEPNITRLGDYISTARFYFSRWNIRKHQVKNQKLKQSLKNFSIGSIMQIRPVEYEQNREGSIDSQNVISMIYEDKSHPDLLKTQNLSKVINHSLLLTIGYFTIATELRLIAAQKYRSCEQTRKSSSQYLQSEIYHIISLIVTSIYVPFDMIYVRHILASFSNHYNGNLSSMEQLNSQNQEQNIILSKQFDPCSFCQGKKKRNINTSSNNLKKKKSLGLEFVNSIKIGQSNLIQGFHATLDRIKSTKVSLNKNKKHSSNSKSKNKKNYKNKESLKSIKNSKSKQRINSEQLVRIEEVCESVGRRNKLGQVNDKIKSDDKKVKVKSLTHKTRKNTPSNNSKTRKKQKQEQAEKPKQEYYRSHKNLDKSKSPRGTAGRSTNYRSNYYIKQSFAGGIEKSSQNAQHSAQLIKNQKHQRSHHKNTNISSSKIEKKKAAPVKKNIDKYYF